jgi:hypothetical protein
MSDDYFSSSLFSFLDTGLLFALRISWAIVRESESPDSAASFSNFSRSIGSRETFKRFLFVLTAQKWCNYGTYRPSWKLGSAGILTFVTKMMINR